MYKKRRVYHLQQSITTHYHKNSQYPSITIIHLLGHHHHHAEHQYHHPLIPHQT